MASSSSSSSSSTTSLRAGSPSRHGACDVANDRTTTRSKSGATNENDHCQDGASTGGTADSRFSCNICFDEVTEPVVTRCGHLYCWPCLFQWLEPGMRPDERESLGMSGFPHGGWNPTRRACPVCKAECPISSVVPLYIRSSSSPRSRSKPSTNNRTKDSNDIDPIGMGANESENDANLDTHESEIIVADEGLRRRRADRASHDSNSNINIDDSEPVPVPNRPSVPHREEPSSPPMSRRISPGSSPRRRASTDNPYRSGAVQLTPRSPNGHNGSLAYGILSSMQRASADYAESIRNSNNHTDEPNRRRIPSLHDRRNPLSNHNADGTGRMGDDDQDQRNINSETTQYLSRLLIMLTSFVIFCFLAV